MKIFLVRPNILRLLFLLVSVLWSHQIVAQIVSIHVNSDSLTIGETFELSLALQLDKEYEQVVFPDTSSLPPSIDLLERQQFKLSEFSDSLVYNLQFFGNQDVSISPLPVTLYSGQDTTTLFTDPVTLNFKTVVAEGDTTLKSMKPNFTFGRMLWPWILALILAGILLYWWFFMREAEKETHSQPKQAIEPFYNPLAELETKLESIKEHSNIAQTKDFKLFYSEVGDAIRAYFEELYQIPALESTSGELLRYLDAYGVDDILTEKTRKILRSADLVKFAKFTPTVEDAWKTYDYALEFLERAKTIDSPRIARLKTKYNEQFIISSATNKSEEA